MGRARSPNYPAISLPEAVTKIRQVYNAEHRNRLSREAIAEVLGYEGLTGSSQPVISALNKYGLLEGRGDSIRVSDDAVAILVDQKGSPERIEAVKRCASSPKIFDDLDGQFENLPSEATARIYLEKSGFTPDAAARCASNYRETRELVRAEAGVYSGDEEGESQQSLRVGDLVQWESQGAFQFSEPRKVVGLSDDGEWVFVEGSPTGVPRGQVIVEEAVDPSSKSELEYPSVPPDTPPRNPYLKTEEQEQNRPGVKRAVLPLDEGEAVFEWPTSIGPTEADDITTWLALLEAKVRRSAGVSTGESTQPSKGSKEEG